MVVTPSHHRGEEPPNPGHWVETTGAQSLPIKPDRMQPCLGPCRSRSAMEKLRDDTPSPWITAPAKQNNTQRRSEGSQNSPKIDAVGQGLGNAVSTKHEQEGEKQ